MKLSVNLPNTPYEIIIQKGELAKVGSWVSNLWQKQKIVLVTDDNVNALYGRSVAEQLEDEGFEVFVFEFPAGESSKILANAE